MCGLGRILFGAALAVTVTAAPARAEPSDDHPVERIKQHEQDLEKKIKTERDRPDKKTHAKKWVEHVEDNIRGLGQEIQSAGHEVRAGAKRDEGRGRAGARAKRNEGERAPQKVDPKPPEKKTESAAPKKLPERTASGSPTN